MGTPSIMAIAPSVVGIATGIILLWVVVAVVVGILLRTVGVLFPRLGMFGSVLSHVCEAGPRLALTFDDGPDPVTTRQILKILEEERCIATFFVVGEKVVEHPELLREMVAAGHGLGLHGFHHDRLHALQPTAFATRDILQVRAAVEAACGLRPRWFRPPVGHASPATFRAAEETGVEIVTWSARGLDGIRGAEPSSVLRRVARRLKPGGIVMLHDASEKGDFVPASVSVLAEIIRLARSRGLTWVTLDELTGVQSLEAGQQAGVDSEAAGSVTTKRAPSS